MEITRQVHLRSGSLIQVHSPLHRRSNPKGDMGGHWGINMNTLSWDRHKLQGDIPLGLLGEGGTNGHIYHKPNEATATPYSSGMANCGAALQYMCVGMMERWVTSALRVNVICTRRQDEHGIIDWFCFAILVLLHHQ